MSAADHSALWEQGKRALDDGLMADAHSYFSQALAADPTHTPTATIVERLQELLELGDEEVDDDDLSERSFSFGDGALSLRLSSDERGDQATGAELWASGPALLEWLCSHPALIAELVEGRAVLELGSGTGVAGLGLRGLGAESVLLTDLPQRLPLLRRNVAANGASGLEARGLAWGSTSALPAEPVSLLVATDVTYDEELVRLLAPTAAALLRANPGAAALFANPRRADFEPRQAAGGEEAADYALLFELLAAEGLPPAEKLGSVAVAASERRGRVQAGVSHVDIHLIRRA